MPPDPPPLLHGPCLTLKQSSLLAIEPPPAFPRNFKYALSVWLEIWHDC